jgi:hypothetical protein
MARSGLLRRAFFYSGLWLAALSFQPALAESPPGSPPLDLESENRRLQAELGLARQPRNYFVIDFAEGKIYLKLRGIVLREMAWDRACSWGGVPPYLPLALQRVTPDAPRRPAIQPGSLGKSGGSPLDALELADMPERYRMELSGGIVLSIGPAPQGFLRRISGAFKNLAKVLIRPILTLWHASRNRPYVCIDITLDRESAQALYWSSSPGIQGFVIPKGHR